MEVGGDEEEEEVMIEEDSLGLVPYTVQLGSVAFGQQNPTFPSSRITVSPYKARRRRKTRKILPALDHQGLLGGINSPLTNNKPKVKQARKSTGGKVGRPPKAQTADETATTMANLANEVLATSIDNELWYPCNQCHKKYKCRSSLDSHVSHSLVYLQKFL